MTAVTTFSSAEQCLVSVQIILKGHQRREKWWRWRPPHMLY